MKKISMPAFSLLVLSASLALLTGCKPSQPAPTADKPKAESSPSASTAPTTGKITLKTDLPPPVPGGTPVPYEVPNLEPILKKFPTFEVPANTVNLARGKKATSSDSEPVIGTLELITDGDKAGDDGSWVELGQGKQWVQIDLEKSADIYALVIWHLHSLVERVYRDVVVQVSDDPTFSKDVTTVYNNSAAGKDRPYIETNFGKLIDAKGVKGRYVRLYSNGNTTSKNNHYIEVEVFGKPE
jgi:hypothetical protein